MNRYRIGKLGVQNFKMFSQYFEIEFSCKDLVVFDGPNGFGKTSVFDALELALTGMIRRLDMYDDAVKNKQKSHGFPFVNNAEQPFFIKLELVSDRGNLIICRSLSKEEVGFKDKGKIKWERIKSGRLEKWENDPTTSSPLSQQELEGLLSTPGLQRIFNIFFYVQQEENTFFLKRSENDRKEYLNILFDVDRESKFLEKVKKLTRLHRDYLSEKDGELKSIKGLLQNSSQLDEVTTVPYEKFFDSDDHEWDKENPDFTKMTFNNVIAGLNTIKSLLESRTDFSKQKEAMKIRAFLSSPDFLLNFILYSVYSESYPQIELILSKGEKLRRILEELNANRYMTLAFWDSNKSELEPIVGELQKKISELIESYLMAKKSHDKAEIARADLNRARAVLLDKFKLLVPLDKKVPESQCPFCGNEWGEVEKLLAAIKIEEVLFSNITQDGLVKKSEEIDEIAKSIRNLVIAELGKNYVLDKELISNIRTSVRSKELFQELSVYLERYKVDGFFKDALKKIEDLKNIRLSVESLTNALETTLQQHSLFNQETYNAWDSILNKYFNGSIEPLASLNKDKVDRKILFLTSRYSSFMNHKNKSLNLQIEAVNKEKELVDEKITQLKDIAKIYEDRIRGHISKIITDISIPFYINSGRILQEFHGGHGIFVTMGQLKTDGVKFFSDIDRENDPLYSLSSGQISSLVLSFSLTLNDVYREHFLGMILIDDPIQTMDEINTITFIDLIRTSFKDRQFIVSTHEENFSSLIRYKFKQNNADVSVVRMREIV